MARRTMTIALIALLVLTGTALALELVNESFESSFPPAGWTVMTSGQGPQWNRTDAQSHTGGWSAVVFYGSASQPQDEWLISPAMDTRDLTQLTLEWWEHGLYWHPLYAEFHEVLYSTTVPDDPSAFTALLHMTPADHTINGMDGDPVVLDLTELIGHETLYLALRYVGTAADHWYVDDVRCYQPESRDVGVNAVGPDQAWFDVGQDLLPTVELENYGGETVDCSVELTVALNGVYQGVQQLTATNLTPGEIRTVSFPPYTAGSAGWYDLSAEINVEGDADPANDQGTAICYAYSGERLPHGLLITSWNCSGCPQANQALDAFLDAHPDDLALVRVHGWWPGLPNDPMYLANVEQCTWLIEDTPLGSDYAPHLWLDGTTDAGFDGADFAAMITAQREVPSPLSVTVASEDDGTRARVTIDIGEPIAPGTDLVLRLAMTEDAVDTTGGNGESHHEQVFRRLYPDTDGVTVSTVTGTHEYVLDTPLDADWDVTYLHLVGWVRDETTKQVYNTGRCAVLSTVAAPVPAGMAGLVGAYPNPCNPRTEVTFRLPIAGPVDAAVYDLAGRRVAVLTAGTYAAGIHRLSWEGRDEAGRAAPSGTYLVRLQTDQGEDSCKLMLCR